MPTTFEVNGLPVTVGDTPEEAGRLAGARASDILRGVLAEKQTAAVIFASAPSQEHMLAEFRLAELPWERLESFHMDEYIGLPSSDPRSFSGWLAERLPKDALANFHRINGLAPSSEELTRYGSLLSASSIDLTCMGIGMNGHMAFNEPGRTDFDDPRPIREITLELASRRQQVDEDCFTRLEDVPTSAFTVTVPELLSAAHLVVTVLGKAKAHAVAQALTGPIGPACPASSIRLHKSVSIFLDEDAAGELGQG